MNYKEAVATAAIALIARDRSRIEALIEAHSIAGFLGGRGYLTGEVPEASELERWAESENVRLDRAHSEKLKS